MENKKCKVKNDQRTARCIFCADEKTSPDELISTIS